MEHAFLYVQGRKSILKCSFQEALVHIEPEQNIILPPCSTRVVSLPEMVVVICITMPSSLKPSVTLWKGEQNLIK